MSNYKNNILIFVVVQVFLLNYKSIILTFTLVRISFLNLSLYKMVYSENSPEKYKTLKISIRAMIKMLKSKICF